MVFSIKLNQLKSYPYKQGIITTNISQVICVLNTFPGLMHQLRHSPNPRSRDRRRCRSGNGYNDCADPNCNSNNLARYEAWKLVISSELILVCICTLSQSAITPITLSHSLWTDPFTE